MSGLTPELFPEPVPASMPETLASAAGSAAPAARPHFVVVTTREAVPEDNAPLGSIIATRFWHPRDRIWRSDFFESLESAIHFFVARNGWTSVQEQSLDARLAHELIFRALETDFGDPPTVEEVLQEAGMTPQEVEDLLEKVERSDPDSHSK